MKFPRATACVASFVVRLYQRPMPAEVVPSRLIGWSAQRHPSARGRRRARDPAGRRYFFGLQPMFRVKTARLECPAAPGQPSGGICSEQTNRLECPAAPAGPSDLRSQVFFSDRSLFGVKAANKTPEGCAPQAPRSAATPRGGEPLRRSSWLPPLATARMTQRISIKYGEHCDSKNSRPPRCRWALQPGVCYALEGWARGRIE